MTPVASHLARVASHLHILQMCIHAVTNGGCVKGPATWGVAVSGAAGSVRSGRAAPYTVNRPRNGPYARQPVCSPDSQPVHVEVT